MISDNAQVDTDGRAVDYVNKQRFLYELRAGEIKLSTIKP